MRRMRKCAYKGAQFIDTDPTPHNSCGSALTYSFIFLMDTLNPPTAGTGHSYFEDDEEESSSNVDLPYIPAENSPTRQQMQPGGGSDSDDDPLDAFMAEVEVRLHLPPTFCAVSTASQPPPSIHPSISITSLNLPAYPPSPNLSTPPLHHYCPLLATRGET